MPHFRHKKQRLRGVIRAGVRVEWEEKIFSAPSRTDGEHEFMEPVFNSIALQRYGRRNSLPEWRDGPRRLGARFAGITLVRQGPDGRPRSNNAYGVISPPENEDSVPGMTNKSVTVLAHPGSPG